LLLSLTLTSAACGSSSSKAGGEDADSSEPSDAATKDDLSSGQDTGNGGQGPVVDSSSPQPDATEGSDSGSISTPDSSTTPDSGSPIQDSGPPAPDDGGVPINSANMSKCSGSNPIACHFGGAIGNYSVTVELGAAAAGNTSVMAEISREMLAPVVTTANETAKYNLMVNVRHPEGQPVADEGSSPSGLDLYFWGNGGASPRLSGIGYEAATPAPIVVYVATDSTGCDQTDTAYAGWAQWLPQYFTSGVSIANYGNSGIDSVTFDTAAPYLATVLPLITSKDFLLIELGDNDKTDTAAQITNALTDMVTKARAKGATPILMTPLNRATFTGSTVNPYVTFLGNVPAIMKQIAASQSPPVPLIDMTTRTTTWLQSLGPNGWQPYFATGATGAKDSTHLNQTGANVVAGFVRDLLRAATSPAVPVLPNYMR
jgi:lysophospholipase L1-like esterase